MSSILSTQGSSLRLFLDSADRAAWERWLPTGLFHGITTNPTILKAAGLSCTLDTLGAIVTEARSLGAREIHAQVWGGTARAYVETGRAIADLGEHVVAKIPVTEDGVRAANALAADALPVTLTALYAPHQAVVAAAVGAAYAAPYLGRIRDAGGDGFATVCRMGAIVRALGSPTRILVASIRSADEVAALAAEGLDTFTISPRVAEELFADPLTLAAAEAFEAHARGE